MDKQIEKVALALAERATERRRMRKEAELPRAVQTALIGSLVGSAGTGVVSALSGRRKKELLRDLVLGAVMGGAGGAAYPYITGVGEELRKKLEEPEMTPQERSKARRTAVSKTIRGKAGPGLQAGLAGTADIGSGVLHGIYGPGSGADIESLLAPTAAGLGTTALWRIGELRQAGLPKWPAKGWRRGLMAASPGFKGTGLGLVAAALTALGESALRLRTLQGTAP